MKYIIDFKPDVTSGQIEEWLGVNGITHASPVSILQNVYLIECDAIPKQSSIVNTITLDENISNQLLGTIEIIPASTGETVEFDHESEWWKAASAYEIDFNTEVSAFERRGVKTTVYVVDSGVQLDHPEFVDANISHLFSFNNSQTDTNGHGTSIASVICGKTLGITSASVKSVKVFDSSKTTMTSDLVRAFDAILADIAATVEAIHIVNLSWSIPKNEYIEVKIQDLINAGAVVVAAAGNNGIGIENVTPASMDEVITVGAYTPDFTPADFSNYTSATKTTASETNYGALDVWAPGIGIGAALLNGTIGNVAGTSIAAGITSACLAYNSDSLYSGVGITPDVVDHLTKYTLTKPNMLLMSDKYHDSVNLMVSFITKPTPTWRNSTFNVTRMTYDTIDMHGYLVQSAYVNKIEIDRDLPAGLTLSNGWIVGRLTNAPLVPTVESYKVTVTFNTGDISYVNLILLLSPPGTSFDNVPEEFTSYAFGCQPSSNMRSCLGTNCTAGCPQCDPKLGDCPCAQECR